MIVDTSALIAVLRFEDDAEVYARAIAEADVVRMSVASYVEAGAAIDAARDPVVSRRLDELLEAAGVVIEPVTAEQSRIARAAYRDFGKDSGHAARLNFGDLFSYALAKSVREPLLFKGDDFARTDVDSVL